MQFYSTKNRYQKVSLIEAVMHSLPPDNGLYMPERIDPLPESFFMEISACSFQENSFRMANQLLGNNIPKNDLWNIVDEAINFDAPLVKLEENIYVLELFHGPSLAFKDFGARFMARLMAWLNRGEDRELTILVATSGDTGGAVAAGFYKTPGIRVIILYPRGKVSELQEKQLTTLGHNITALEVNGTFDDCQALVKQAFLDKDLNKRFQLSSANSINIARLIPQSFYYVEAYRQWRVTEGMSYESALEKKLVYSVPSGNFGNLTAGIIAKRLGLPVYRFLAANNANDSVCRYLRDSIFRPLKTIPAISNAMDVGNPSNFQRLIDLYSNHFSAHPEDNALEVWRSMRQEIAGYSFSDAETRQEIKRVYEQFRYILDPHGAVGSLALVKYISENPGSTGIQLETAHPAKFLPVMREVLDVEVPVPERLRILGEREKRAICIAKDFEKFKGWMMREG